MANDQHVMSFNRFRSYFFFALVFLLAGIALYIIRPFVFPIFWAAVIAVMFYPIYHLIEKYVKFPGVSSIICVILVIVTLLLPLFLVSLLIVQETQSLYTQALDQNLLNIDKAANSFDNTFLEPYISALQNELTAAKDELTKKAPEAIRSFSLFLGKNLLIFTQNSLRFVFLLFIMLYSLFFFFKDGEKILSRFMHLSPLGDKAESVLFQRFRSTTRATLKSTLLLGMLQGALGAIIFAITGVEGAIIWGVIMAMCSVIPAIGAFVVWLPAGLIMLALGNVWQAVVIILFGAIVISNIDNLLRPILVGKDTALHPLLVLFSTLGGIFMFGLSGFVIGPVIMSLFLAVLSMYDQYYEKELENN